MVNCLSLTPYPLTISLAHIPYLLNKQVNLGARIVIGIIRPFRSERLPGRSVSLRPAMYVDFVYSLCFAPLCPRRVTLSGSADWPDSYTGRGNTRPAFPNPGRPQARPNDCLSVGRGHTKTGSGFPFRGRKGSAHTAFANTGQPRGIAPTIVFHSQIPKFSNCILYSHFLIYSFPNLLIC